MHYNMPLEPTLLKSQQLNCVWTVEIKCPGASEYNWQGNAYCVLWKGKSRNKARIIVGHYDNWE